MRYLNCAVIAASLPMPGLTSAQPQPDYSGAWQQVNARCVPKPKNKHASYRSVIEQNPAALHLLITTNKGQLNLQKMSLKGILLPLTFPKSNKAKGRS
jgi:hypothetical protein